MRILVLSWRDPKHPLAGGAEQVMHEHMKGWIKAGHSVTFYSSKIKGRNTKEIIDGIKIIRGGSQYIGVQISAFFYYLKNKDKFDFIVDEFHGLPFFTPIYINKPKIAVVQETARQVWFLNPFAFPLNYLIGIIGFLAEPFFFIFYKKTSFATGSLSAKKDVIKMGIPTNNIFVWPHGKKIIKLNKKIKKETKKTICFLGVLSKDKGILDAIECFKILSKTDTNYQFWVIGKPETNRFEEEIKKRVRDSDLKNRVKFLGFLTNEKKFETLSKAHVLINPSVREGWGLVNIEANSVGIPVVSYKSAGLVDSVKNNYSGIFVTKNDSENLAKVVNGLLNDDAKYRKICKTSKLWSERFKWENSIKISLNTIINISRSSHTDNI